MRFRTLSIVAAVAVVLFATNPTVDDYVGWLKQQVADSGPAGEHQREKALFSFIGGPFVSVRQAVKTRLRFTSSLPAAKDVGSQRTATSGWSTLQRRAILGFGGNLGGYLLSTLM